MSFFDFLKPVANVAANLIPGGPAVLALVNKFLPEDKKLPADANGAQLQKAAESLPPDAQVKIKELATQLGIAQEEGWTSRYSAMVAADGQSTRPKIALMMAKVLSFEIILFTCGCVWAIIYKPEALDSSVLWPIFGTLTLTPAGLLGKYFGELRKEQGQRLGVDKTSILGGVMKMVGVK